ncbi:scavenger receptor cysteine-rich type 1 protein M130 [Fundulus heteroclitus]|uniref:scavenger receptor cysteine-rich type 1 protein M130 n=1 Tax=Fundulus heteroclitus TaxID=8078 RepID=UPI00165C0B5B|nr:scavenger receptor cysteine-rich type 1 protein M130 [Fundulus heteroclitus]
MRNQGNWEKVRDLRFTWNLTMAAEVCRELDCGSVVSMKRDDLYSWQDFKMEITCSDTVRLVDGNGLCSGRLEVKSDMLNQSWTSVNQDGFDQKDAELVCRELGCGPLSVLQGKPYIDAGASLSLKCRGSEAALSDCPSSVWKNSGKVVSLSCSESKDVRLVGGSSRCAGTLQMKFKGEWKLVYKNSWTLKFAGEVCKQLDCGSPLSITRRMMTSEKVLWELRNCDGPSLKSCVQGIVHSEYFNEMTCSDSVRLVNGINHCSGRLEVKPHELWSLVCEDGFNHQDAEVLCREIGCGPALVVDRRRYGEMYTLILKKEIPCGVNESSLLNCGRPWLRKSTCPSNSKSIWLTCSDPEVRFVGGANRCTGNLEIKQFGRWRAAGDRDEIRDWPLMQTNVICQRLDCGMPFSRQIILHSTKSVSQIDFFCTHTLECIQVEHIEIIFRVKITCSDSVRLVNSSNHCSGRLELKTNQSWSTVCEKDFDMQDAEVACRELGCGSPVILQGALFGGEKAPLKRREFHCEGNELALRICKSSDSARKPCSPENILGLTCSGYLRLAGEKSSCAGTLEMLYQGQWRPVADKYDRLETKLFASVCAELGCGTFVSVTKRIELSASPVWWILSHCPQSLSELRECVVLDDATHDSSFEVRCSDSVRLVNSSNHCSGRLELKTNQSWSTVCEKEFDMQDAEVACRELGCGSPVILQGALFGGEKVPLKRREFHCEGNELVLQECKSSDSARKPCSPENILGLTCSGYLRLAGEKGSCAGTLEMLYHGEWRPVADKYYLLETKLAASVCAELGCGTFVSVTKRMEPSSSPVWWIHSSCPQSLSELQECVVLDDATHDSSFEVRCSDSVRLVNSSNHCSGRLELKTNQSWSTVCEKDFDMQDAEVACRELGCGSPVILQGALFGGEKAPLKRREFHCEGNELVLPGSVKAQTQPESPAHLKTFLDSPVQATSGWRERRAAVLGLWRCYTMDSGDQWLTSTSVDFIIRPFVVLMGMMISISILYCYFKVRSRKKIERVRIAVQKAA